MQQCVRMNKPIHLPCNTVYTQMKLTLCGVKIHAWLTHALAYLPPILSSRASAYSQLKLRIKLSAFYLQGLRANPWNSERVRLLTLELVNSP